MSAQEHLRAILQAGGLAVLACASTSAIATASVAASLAVPEVVAAAFALLVIAGASRVARIVGGRDVTVDAYVRIAEVVVAFWCVERALRSVSLLWAPEDGSVAIPSGTRLGVSVAAYVALAAVLLLDPRRVGGGLAGVGRWMRQTFGPIPKRD